MSEKTNISQATDAFFQLWQRQVSLLAQAPDKSFEQLLVAGEKIVSDLQKSVASEQETSPEDTNRNQTDLP